MANIGRTLDLTIKRCDLTTDEADAIARLI